MPHLNFIYIIYKISTIQSVLSNVYHLNSLLLLYTKALSVYVMFYNYSYERPSYYNSYI